jgi:hypothetical protein
MCSAHAPDRRVPVQDAILALMTVLDIERLSRRLGRSAELLIADRAASRVRIMRALVD